MATAPKAASRGHSGGAAAAGLGPGQAIKRTTMRNEKARARATKRNAPSQNASKTYRENRKAERRANRDFSIGFGA